MARRRRGLTPEERELWSRVARSATPLPSKSQQPEEGGAQDAPPVIPRAGSKAKAEAALMRAELSKFRLGQHAPGPTGTFQREASPAERLRSAPLRMDHKTHRKMSQGKIAPQARLDLHGLTLSAAHPELIQFILGCHANALRLVLVITGKGRGDHGPLPTRPGALRHQVPYWLHSPPLNAVVQQVSAAHYRHGGEGAYYVYLRRSGIR
ncbi:Smr/MutS family protein [Paracoccus seriniphilus]|uniref:DNA-nicking endonuclease, Smr domain n=1 Tax=Paracoccus seriniphilus TaxID=184748 RepID=A0A239PX90_9RHOB|nr:Smr/MutS family protein [Paracoccus seriniphilus]WCR14041.1 Smr/MutS family protein [Paracoccus seriniphilus]SNT74939.1 DNA-nicking endonuclease, Smr domain [Paracoccus seriniphilus]